MPGISTENKLTVNNTISTNALKILAIIAMVSDHIPYLSEFWAEQYYTFPWFLMHAFGRLTAPIFFYLLALGYRRTRNANRYTIRLLIFALISYIPYIWYFKGTAPGTDAFLNYFLELNIIFTLLIGLLLLRTIHEVRNNVIKGILIVLLLLAGFWCDYGLYGIAMILVCDACKNSRRNTVLGIGIVMMVSVYIRVSGWLPGGDQFFDSFFGTVAMMFNPSYWMFGSVVVMLCQLIPLIFIARHRVWIPGYTGERRPSLLAKWGFYIFYPAHITVLLLIKLFLIS